MADVILIYPELQEGERMGRMLPLSLLYPATPLAEKGYHVEILDQRVDRNWPETLRGLLQGDEVLCVGVSSMTGSQIEGGLAASRIVKENSPETPVIWGGVHPSILPEQTLVHPWIDAVIVGEGEETLLQTVEELAARNQLSKIPGLCLLSEGKPVSGGRRPPLDLNSFSPLAYHLVNVRHYTRPILEGPSEEWIALLTSRGCPYGCTYCYADAFHHRRWTALTPERTLEEIERIIRDFSIHHLFLFDDNFFVDTGRVEEICRLIIERRLPVKIHNANWRIDSILTFDPERMSLLKAAGLEKVFVGVESGSDEVLSRIGKGFASAEILEANRKLTRAGIEPVYAFMTGFPFESRTDTKATLRLMDTLLSDNPDAQIPGMSLYAPFPGTPLYEECLRRGMKMSGTLEGWSAISYTEPNLNGFDSRDQRYFHRTALFSQFLDSKNLYRKGKIKNLFFFLVAGFARLRVRLGLETLVPERFILSYSKWRRRNK